MDDIAAFISARLDEDEAAAYPKVCGCLDANHVPSCVPTPWLDRPRRELAAKRGVMALHKPNSKPFDQWTRCYHCNDTNGEYRAYPCPDVRLLASIWSEHPDYRQEWLGSPS